MIRHIPNIITITRIISVPILAVLIAYGYENHLLILVLFIIAALSDFFDGYLARKLNAMSEFGKMLDPIADKLLVGILFLALAAAGTLSEIAITCAILILFREIFVSGLREYFAGQLSLPVSFVAKVKTTVQLIAIGLILAIPIAPSVSLFADITIVVAAFLTLYTGMQYFIAGIRYTKSKDS